MRKHRRFNARATPFVGLLLLAACSDPPPERAPAAQGLVGAAGGWNVLLLSIDTLRADRLGAYGYRPQGQEISPQIDRLLTSGVLFERASAPRALTWPSLASVLTGLYPSGHGLVANGYNLADDQATLATLLSDEGYQTGAFLANMCRANHRGWEAFACGGGVDGKVTERALAWARDLDPERPFLLWAHYFGAHPPYYNGGDAARDRLDPGYSGMLAPKKGVLDRVMTEGIELDAADRRHLDALYDAAVAGSDAHVGRLLAELEAAGRLERTLVVFLADHGEELYQHHRYLYHACSVYETALHVPLGLTAPGLVPEGGRVVPRVELIDVLPTVAELLGLEIPVGVHGRSLVPYLERPERPGAGKPAFSEYDHTRIRTVAAGAWKLIDNPDRIVPVCMPGAPADLFPIAEVELYNLAEDPLETRNLAAQRPQKVAELRRLLEERFSSLPGAPSQELPEGLKEELEALGYVAD